MNKIKKNNYDVNGLWMGIFASCVGIRGASNILVKRTRYFYFSFLFLGTLRDERFIFICSSFRRAKIDNKKIIKYCFIAYYTHKINGLSKFLALFHVTT
jgi:hypothetical protein